jgi:hypothetical protein
MFFLSIGRNRHRRGRRCHLPNRVARWLSALRANVADMADVGNREGFRERAAVAVEEVRSGMGRPLASMGGC